MQAIIWEDITGKIEYNKMSIIINRKPVKPKLWLRQSELIVARD
jgi:hypothetical protein